MSKAHSFPKATPTLDKEKKKDFIIIQLRQVLTGKITI